MNDLSTILKTLTAVEADTTLAGKEPSEFITGTVAMDSYPDATKKLLGDLVSQLCGYMIRSDGTVNKSLVSALKQCGYQVTAGEQDSFGWLSGVVHTRVGRVVFG